LDFCGWLRHVSQVFEGPGDAEAGAIEPFQGLPEGADRFTRDTVAAESDEVEAEDGIVFAGEHEGWDIGSNACPPADHGHTADPGELVDGGTTAEDNIVLNIGVPCDHDVIGQDDPVADDGVVRDVGHGHEKAVITDGGLRPFTGPTVQGDPLAEDVAIADLEVAGAAGPGNVLGREPEHGPGEHLVILSEAGAGCDDGVGTDGAAVTDDGIGLDDRKGADCDVGADFRFGVDDGGGVKAGGHRGGVSVGVFRW